MWKNLRIITVLALVLTLITGMTACGSSTASAGQTGDTQSAAQTAAPEAATVEMTLPEADPKAGADAMLGNWKDISAAESFAIITRTDDGYQYEDNDGKYPAVFENGVLNVKATDTDTAKVYIDPKTGHLLTEYQGGLSEFEKK